MSHDTNMFTFLWLQSQESWCFLFFFKLCRHGNQTKSLLQLQKHLQWKAAWDIVRLVHSDPRCFALGWTSYCVFG